MGERKRKTSDGEEQKNYAAGGGGEWWERARDRQMFGQCKRKASDVVETCRRDTQLMGEANDGDESYLNSPNINLNKKKYQSFIPPISYHHITTRH